MILKDVTADYPWTKPGLEVHHLAQEMAVPMFTSLSTDLTMIHMQHPSEHMKPYGFKLYDRQTGKIWQLTRE